MNRAIRELESLATWVRTGDYNPGNYRDEIARAIKNRVRVIREEQDKIYYDLMEMRPPGL